MKNERHGHASHKNFSLQSHCQCTKHTYSAVLLQREKERERERLRPERFARRAKTAITFAWLTLAKVNKCGKEDRQRKQVEL